jgi:hypothetical protein
MCGGAVILKFMIHSIGEILNQTKSQSQYSDPRWNEKRKQVLRSKQDFCCESCRRKDIPLQAHHIYYAKGKELWDYPDSDFHVMCEGCHREWHELLVEFRRTVAGHIPNHEFKVLVRCLSVAIKHHRVTDMAMAICQLVCEPDTIKSLIQRWGSSK